MITVVGDVMLDQAIEVDTNRISPEFPQPVFEFKSSSFDLGGAANVAANIKSLGSDVLLIGSVGQDEMATKINELCDKFEIEFCPIVDEKSPTTVKSRYFCGASQVFRLDKEAHFNGTRALKIVKKKLQSLDCSYVVLSDYNKGTLGEIQEIVRALKALQVKVIVDPKHKDFSRYRGAYILTPNLNEFRRANGSFISESELVMKAMKCCRIHSISYILITMGADGMLLVNQDGALGKFPTEALEVFDVTGAGDTVVAALTYALGEGSSLQDAVEYANKAAGIAVSRKGTAKVTHLDMLREQKSVLSPAQLKSVIKMAREKNKKIVMTNGCFDILHPGHLGLLHEAKTHGDILIVVLNSDNSVKKLKGKKRPINLLDDRAKMIKSISAVDYVTFFDELTPEKFYAQYTPDVLVKGSDYDDENIIGSDVVKDAGGEVKRVQFLEGYSTSNLVNKILGG